MKSDVNSGSPPGGHQSEERRSSQRIQTKRDVLFSDYEATGPLRVGMAVDMSAGGFKISSRYPEAVGTEIQIELQPQPGDQVEVVLFRGRVMHVEPLEAGDFAMGIKLLQQGAARTGGLSRGLLPLAAKAAESNAQDAAAPRPHAAAQSAQNPSTPRRVVFSKVEKRKPKRRKWLPWGSLLILLSIFCALLFQALRDDGERFPTGLFGGKFVSARSNSEQDLEPGLAKTQAAGQSSQDYRAAGPYEWSSREATDALLVRAQAAMDQGDLDDAANLFKQLEQHPEAHLIHRFASLLGYAETAAARGELSLARQTVQRALELGAGVPEPWRRAGRELAAKLNKNRSTPFETASMDSVILIEAPSQEIQAQEALLRIEVDASEYLLSIVKGNVILRSFPIGLGFAGRTPIGEFQIANKISEPDWYNRGDVVLAGAPDNPLGSSWMGLGDGTSASSYGIHPTADAGSIGESLSQGCVRMHPRDAEALFRLVPIGTPVLIRP